MLFAFYLHYFLFFISLSYAHRQCLQVLDAAFRLPIHGPSYIDCRNAIRHLPFFPEAANNPVTNSSAAPHSHPRQVTSTHPYFPISDVISDSCLLILRFYEGRVPLTMNDMESSENWDRPKWPLTGESVRKIWNAQRNAAEQVVENCVYRGLGGIQWEPIDLPETPFVWYAALLRDVKSGSSMAEREQRALLAEVDVHSQRTRRWPFDGNVYHV